MRGQYGTHQTPGRGVYGVHVGVSLYHTVGDRERAIAQIGTGFRALEDEVMMMAGWRADPYHPAEGPIWDWWRSAGVPVIEEWQRFQADQMGSFSTRFATDWEAYETWQARLAQLRDTAKAHGLKLNTPTPVPLKKTIPGQITDFAGNAAKDVECGIGDVWTVLKVGVYGALGLGAIIALSSVVQNMKQGKDPADKLFPIVRLRR